MTKAMRTNLRAVAVLRNVCAHHSRVWNRIIHSDKPRLFTGVFPGEPYFRRYAEAPWGVISVLGHFVRNVRGDDTFMTDVASVAKRNVTFWRGLTDPDRR